LNSIITQVHTPTEVIIVNNGKQLSKNIRILFKNSKIKLLILKNDINGTARARNKGISKAEGDIIFLFDDDVILNKNYIYETLKAFDSQIAIIVGNIVNQNKTRFSFFKRIFMLDQNKPYSVLASGKNVINTHNTFSPTYVDWASGGAMAIRKRIAQLYCFNEDYDIEGYGLAEDLDYTYRISRKHKILFLPTAKLFHKHTFTGRINEYKLGFIQVRNRYLFVQSNMNTLMNKILFFWGIIGEMIINFISIFILGKKMILRLAGNFKGLWFIILQKS
jgi:GT2 family glycosyltransferase